MTINRDRRHAVAETSAGILTCALCGKLFVVSDLTEMLLLNGVCFGASWKLPVPRYENTVDGKRVNVETGEVSDRDPHEVTAFERRVNNPYRRS